MSVDEDIRRQLDRSFGDGPAPAPTDELLVRGHRALRRRRVVAAGSATLVVLVLGGTSVLTMQGPGDTKRTTGQVAAPPSAATSSASTPVPTPTPTSHRPTHAQITYALSKPIVDLDSSGHLETDAEVVVVRKIDNPFAKQAKGKSVAVVAQYRGANYWFALYSAPDGSGSGASGYSGDFRQDFATWVKMQAPIADDSSSSVGPGVWPGIADLNLVRFAGGTERLSPVGSATILEQRAHVSVGTSWAGPNDQTAAAEVRGPDGKVYYVLARRFDGKPGQYIAVKRSDGGRSLTAFLDLARQRYASGGGGLL